MCRWRPRSLLPDHSTVLGDLTADHFAERFDVYEVLGTGLVGRIHRAWDRVSQCQVAIKVLRRSFVYFPGLSGFAGAYPAASLLRRESRLHADFEHPGICSYLDSGDTQETPWLALEYVDGGRLSDQDLPLPVSEVLHIVREIAAALEYLHTAGYVHRDVKPSNINFRKDGRPVLMDLGLVQRTFHSPEFAVQRAMGSPGYVPPECQESTAFDIELTPRADIFSLGRVIEWMLEGSGMRSDVRSPMPASGAAISQVIERATRMNPDQRYPDIPALLSACELALG